MILNLGCGNRPMADAINHDLFKHSEHVDVCWDLEAGPWPTIYLDTMTGLYELVPDGEGRDQPEPDWEDQSDNIHAIVARDVLEHVSPSAFYRVMDECWKTLSPGQLMHIQVPEWGSTNHVIDPTHWRGFHLDSFDFLDPTTRLGRQSWTTDRRWKIVEKRRKPKSDVNLLIKLEKLA